MASIDRRPDGQWRARWREYPGGPQRSKHFARKLDAERHLVKVQHDLLTGAYVRPELGRITYREVAGRYVDRAVWRPGSHKAAREKLAHSLARFGDRPVASLRRGELQAWLTGLPFAPTTVSVIRQHLAAALQVAVEDGLIVANPARGLKVPRRDLGQIVPLEVAQVDALLEAAPSWWRAGVVLGAGLGLRASEAAGLTVDRVDWLRRTVRVDRQWNQLTGTKPGAHGPPKTEASSRTIPAADEILAALSEHVARYGTCDGGFVVHHEGRPIDGKRWAHLFRRAANGAGLPATVSYHDLRHFFASALISAGCSVKAVQKALGHRSAAMTLDVYSHLFPGDEDRIRAAAGRLFSTG